MIAFIDVRKRFGAQEVLRGVSFSVHKGGVHFVVGKSGAGKSVLIKQVVGLLKPDSGRITLDGEPLQDKTEAEFFFVRRRCQLIFQNATLFDALSVLDNLIMPIQKRFTVSQSEARDRAWVALEQVDATAVASRLPAELGAGVQKRVAIARALALEPEVLLYDEPTTSLDPVAARRTDRLILEMAERFGTTALVVSHDMTSVAAIAQQVTYLVDGRVYFDGAKEAFIGSDDALVREFVSPLG